MQDKYILHFRAKDMGAFEGAFRRCGTVLQFRTRLGWLSGFAESITVVTELHRPSQLLGRESANPATRWRLDLPGRGWM